MTWYDVSFCPKELQMEGGKAPPISIEDKRSEEYTAPPAPAYVAFSDAGQSLGYVALAILTPLEDLI